MAPWTSFMQRYSHRVSKPPPLSLITICLGLLSTFLVFVYITYTSHTYLSPHSKPSSSSPFLVLKPYDHKLISQSDGSSRILISSSKDSLSPARKYADDHQDFHGWNSSTIHYHLVAKDTTHATKTVGLESPGTGSSIGNPTNTANAFHDEEIFLQNYEEMKRKLKIYIYPPKKNDPFANVLLPTNYGQEPGGNYASEAYFKNVLFKSHFVTGNPLEADLFFMPFSIASLRHDKRVGVGGLQKFVKHYMEDISRDYPHWNQTGGADHFYVACHSIGRMAMEKAEQVKSNAIQVVCSSSYFLPNYFSHKDVCLPQIWPRHEEPPELASSKRKKLAFFAGSDNAPVRKELIQAWRNDSSIFAHSGRLKTPYSEQLLRSKYCLHVKGYEVNTARVGDALFYGCVPVILADYYDLPFMDILDWSSFSVVITSSDIPNLKKILRNISAEKYSKLQANVLKVRRHFQWNKSPKDFDAFYMVMYELWLRRSSIRLFS